MGVESGLAPRRLKIAHDASTPGQHLLAPSYEPGVVDEIVEGGPASGDLR